ncbi:MAG TPA: hypothetical protein VJR89_22120, partial [Polyangiales bacterium]|nr:hypothetical protein [Polyangiales bacterium]
MRSQAAMLCLLSASFAQPLSAQAVRVVVLPSCTLDGQPADEAALDAAVSGALQQAGLRIVDLASALRAQRAALSDAVQAGKLPNELSALNADVLLSLQLRCAQSSDAVLGSKLRAEQCALASKAVAVSSGDVLFARNQSFTGHGLNAQMAVQGLIDKRVPAAVTQASSTWLAALTGADSWEIDLSVARVSDRETGRALAKQLARVPGVTGARLIAYDRGLAKYAVAGRGRDALEGLAGAIEADPELALAVTYETARVLHAEFDFVKAYKQRVMAMSIVPRGSQLSGVAPEVMRAALMNLPYLDLAHTLPLTASPEDARRLEQRLRDKAKSLGVPLLVAASLSPAAQGWLATLKLVDTGVGRTLTAASATAQTSTLALDQAVHAFDERFRAEVQRAPVRQRFGFGDLATKLANDRRLVVQAFKLREGAAQLTGTLELRNATQASIRGARLSLRAVDRELAVQALPEIAPGAVLAVPVTLAAQGISAVTATVSYELDAGYASVEAVVPLVLTAAGG